MLIWILKLHYEMMQRYVKAYLFTNKWFSYFSKQYELSLVSIVSTADAEIKGKSYM